MQGIMQIAHVWLAGLFLISFLGLVLDCFQTRVINGPPDRWKDFGRVFGLHPKAAAAVRYVVGCIILVLMAVCFFRDTHYVWFVVLLGLLLSLMEVVVTAHRYRLGVRI